MEEAGAPHRGAALLTWRITAGGCGGSERHQAQHALLQNRVDLTGRGIGYGGQIRPGARLNDGVDQPRKEVWLELCGSDKGVGGMSDERHGWSHASWVDRPGRFLLLLLRCSKGRGSAGWRNAAQRAPV